MSTQSLPSRLLAGAGAGLAATVGMQGMRTATQKWVPQTMPPIKQDPGKFMVDRAESVLPPEKRERVPETVESTAASLLHLGYGMTAGLLYAALGSRRAEPAARRTGGWARRMGRRLPRLAATHQADAAGHRAAPGTGSRSSAPTRHIRSRCGHGVRPAAVPVWVRLRFRRESDIGEIRDPRLVGE